MSAKRTSTSFPERLRVAEYVTNHPPQPPLHVVDQIDAAGTEAAEAWMRPTIEAAVAAGGRVLHIGGPEVEALLLAAAMGCTPCCHIRRNPGNPQPVLVALALRLALCGRCTGTKRNPPPDEDDRCDVCGSRGNNTFVAFSVAVGPMVLIGDAGPCCVDRLGVAA